MILADPSELRAGTPLPVSLQGEATPCPGLEERTGADLVVSHLSLPFGSDTLLRRHTEAGVMVQRKSGQDLPASITDGRLSRSLERMLAWGPRPVLAVVGQVSRRSKELSIDGRTSLPYASYMGALDWWQVRGGLLAPALPDHSTFYAWLKSWEKKLLAIQEHPEKVLVRTPDQDLVIDEQLGLLAALPGLGPKRAEALRDAAEGRLAHALVCLTQDSCKVPGIGAGIRDGVRTFLSMEEGERLFLMSQGEFGEAMGCLLDEVGVSEDLTRLYARLAKWGGVPCAAGDWDTWWEEMEMEVFGNEDNG